MGLNDLVNGEGGEANRSTNRRYGNHEYNEQLEEWLDELAERFPVEPDISFIEVSPRLEKNKAKVYLSSDETYIRVKEGSWEHGDWLVRQGILYCLVRAYFYQTGFPDVGPSNDEFKWVCGQVGAATNAIDLTGDVWLHACTPFFDSDEDLSSSVFEAQIVETEPDGDDGVPPEE